MAIFKKFLILEHHNSLFLASDFRTIWFRFKRNFTIPCLSLYPFVKISFDSRNSRNESVINLFKKVL